MKETIGKSKFVNKHIYRNVCYSLTEGLESKLKYQFYKAVILYYKIVSLELSVDSFDYVKNYIDSLVQSDNFTNKINMELLLLQRDLIMIKYLGLKTIN